MPKIKKLVIVVFTVDCSNISAKCENCSIDNGECFKCKQGTYLKSEDNECYGRYKWIATSYLYVVTTWVHA